ncbi:hypothetical protein FIBSPDRAFT_1055902 [Athelia psychrophila]|uniref:F-box domain-containing protein n=1 Tax=Athelia psychrophila TaxID=1759441 RepID=A0A167SZG7_9AGAM|nr:hypothetical protein FIBSPDRAFT_1055902 [Fibularhizoctonia sp. CBS 109695]
MTAMPTVANSTALGVMIERPLPSYAMPSCGPIERIPPGTLSNIFTAFMPDNPPRAQDCNSPVALACVCRRWRDIVLSTPQLWTSLHLMLAPSTIVAPRQAHRENMAIAIRCLALDDQAWVRGSLSVLQHGTGVSRRPRNSLRPCSSLEETHMPDVRGHLSSLEHLDFEATFEPGTVPHVIDASDQAPCPPHFKAMGLGLDRFAFDLMDGFAFPSLRNISLYVSVFGHRHSPDDEESCGAKFISLLKRSQCPIQNFSLGCDDTGHISENDLLNCLHALPAMHELKLVECVAFSLGEQALSRLTESTGDKHPLVPELQVLEIPWALATRIIF